MDEDPLLARGGCADGVRDERALDVAHVESGIDEGAAGGRLREHTSTVKYRISRLEALLERRLTDPKARFELQLSIALLDFLWATGLRTPSTQRT